VTQNGSGGWTYGIRNTSGVFSAYMSMDHAVWVGARQLDARDGTVARGLS